VSGVVRIGMPIVLGALLITNEGARPASTPLAHVVTHALPAAQVLGSSVAVVRDGTIVLDAQHGYVDPKRAHPVDAGTRFAIGSLTKQFTAAGILLLAERKQLSLDDPLAKYLPQLPNASTITLRMLLDQTSGLHNYPTREHDWPIAGPIAPSAIFAVLATDRPDFPPGTQWEYSNSNYAALAGVIARVSGMPYQTFLARNIFEPLKMTQTSYGYAGQRAGNLAGSYAGPAFAVMRPQVSLDLYYGAGGLISTAHDLALWDIALLEGRVLESASMQAFFEPGHLSDGSPTNYAMGWVPGGMDGQAEVWHNGWVPGEGGYCYNALFPQRGIAVVVLTNGDQGTVGSVPENVVRAALETLVPAPTPEPPTEAGAHAIATVRAVLTDLESGNFSPSLYTPKTLAAFSAQAAALKAAFAGAGQPNTLEVIDHASDGGATVYHLRAAFAAGTRTITLTLSSDGLVSGFFLGQ